MTAKDRFGKALQTGLAAADQADASQKEIQDAIVAVGESIRDSTGGVVTAYSQKTPVEMGMSMTSAIGEALGQPDAPRSTTLGVFASVQHEDSNSRERLCLVTFSKMGFPVQVQWAGENRVCNSRDAFMDALELVLANPNTGRKIRGLLEWHKRQVRMAAEKAAADGGTEDKT